MLVNFFCVWAWVRPEFSKVFAKNILSVGELVG